MQDYAGGKMLYYYSDRIGPVAATVAATASSPLILVYYTVVFSFVARYTG